MTNIDCLGCRSLGYFPREAIRVWSTRSSNSSPTAVYIWDRVDQTPPKVLELRGGTSAPADRQESHRLQSPRGGTGASRRRRSGSGRRQLHPDPKERARRALLPPQPHTTDQAFRTALTNPIIQIASVAKPQFGNPFLFHRLHRHEQKKTRPTSQDFVSWL